MYTHIRKHNTHTYGLTPQFTMKQCQVAKYTYVPSSLVSIGDSSEGKPPMEELGDAKGLLGGWGAEGGTEQGEVIQ